MWGLNSPRSELALAEAELQARKKEVQARRDVKALRQSRKALPKPKGGEGAEAQSERFREIKERLEAQLETRHQRRLELEEALARLPTPPWPTDCKEVQAKESQTASSIWQSRIATLQEELRQKSEKVAALRLREQQLEAELRNRLHADVELLPGLREAAAELRSAFQRLPGEYMALQATAAASAQPYDSARSHSDLRTASASGSPPKSCVLNRVGGDWMSPRHHFQESFASTAGEAPRQSCPVSQVSGPPPRGAFQGLGSASRQPRPSAGRNPSEEVDSTRSAVARTESNSSSCAISGVVFPQPRGCSLSMPSSWQPPPRGAGSGSGAASAATNEEQGQPAPTLLSIGKITDTKGLGHAGCKSGGWGPQLNTADHGCPGRSMTPPARLGAPVAVVAQVPRQHGPDVANHAFSKHAAALASEQTKVQPCSGAGPWVRSVGPGVPGPAHLGGVATSRHGEPAQSMIPQAQLRTASSMHPVPQMFPRQMNFGGARRALTPPPMNLLNRSRTPTMGSLVTPSVPGYAMPAACLGGMR
eukprot:TRINITY_DN14439_c1_g1_i1.p1 TRINITY_DN14439_c1_g1~~TRINITY_DN14439_c1_g1_i1.p1  ORF type:complete len:534 (-),score=91.19 TRINITY_DN14439_c1_g1_i1:248-1849(-)